MMKLRRRLKRELVGLPRQDERANWMYDHIVRHFQYLSTRDNLEPHLQIDPFLGREIYYPPYGYTGPMPPGYDYRYGPAPGGYSLLYLFDSRIVYYPLLL
ncbi:hypothetical protein Tco_0203559, partial [Tanacetum coccineum]